jgi:hypothetical protein
VNIVAPITPEQFETLLPLACEWATTQERYILGEGAPLPPMALADAGRAGVMQPQRVRILHVAAIPIPRAMIVHELGHTAQYERLGGGFEPFLRQYLFECLTIGYPEAPMEQEVIALTSRICGDEQP